MNAHRQSSAGIAGADRFVGGWCRHVYGLGRSAENVFGAHAASDFRAVFVLGDWEVYLDDGRNITFPAAPYERVAFGFEETVTLRLRSRDAYIERG